MNNLKTHNTNSLFFCSGCFIFDSHWNFTWTGAGVWWVIIPNAIVVEGIMFFYPSISQSLLFSISVKLLWNRSTEFSEIVIQFFSMALLNLEIILKQFFIATPLNPLHRVWLNFVVKEDILCVYAYSQEIWFNFFLREHIILCANFVKPV